MVIWVVLQKQKVEFADDNVYIKGVFDTFQKAKVYAISHIEHDIYLNGCDVGDLEFRLFKKNNNEVEEDSIFVYNEKNKLDYILSIIPTYLQ